MTTSAARRASVLPFASEAAPNASAPQLARLVKVTEHGAFVECVGELGRLQVARSLVEAGQLLKMVGREVLVVFVGMGEPVIVGIVQPPLAASAPDGAARELTSPSTDTAPLATEAVVDGKRIVIRGAEEISFQCGESSIAMFADGRIVVHGNYVETRARKLNRIRGGSIKIN